MLFKLKSSKKKYQWIMLMTAILLPGLILSTLGIISLSQQNRVRELRIQKEFQTTLDKIRDKIEEKTAENVNRTFESFRTIQPDISYNYEESIINSLKKIILDNPVVKYPFIIDQKGAYIFPISRGKKLQKENFPVNSKDKLLQEFKKRESEAYLIYQRAENLEFKERDFFGAIKSYLLCQKIVREKRMLPYILYGISRCYYKLNKYSQANAYLISIRNKFKDQLEEDEELNIQILFSLARITKHMKLTNSAINFYLQMYERILRHEASDAKTRFGFFKNEALDYLNRSMEESQKDKKVFDRMVAIDGLGNLSKLDISLRWKYFDPELLKSISFIEESSDDAFSVNKITEFYLPNDEKTLFYQEVKKLALRPQQHQNSGTVTTKNSPRGEYSGIVYSWFDSHHKSTPTIVFGFMVSMDFIIPHFLHELKDEYLGDKRLTLHFEDKDKAAINTAYRFNIHSATFNHFFSSKKLILSSSIRDHVRSMVNKELWINYGLIAVVIAMLILGTLFFTKYISRESELVKMKSQFVDSASHTLKTPLTKIRMAAEKLELNWIKEESKKKEYFKSITLEADRMAEMIANMLDFSKLESGEKFFNKQKASLTEEVKRIIKQQSEYIKSMGFTLSLDLKEVPDFLLDPKAIQIIITNLIQNALIYSLEEKHIEVKVYRQKKYALLLIRDKGIGMAPEQIPRIFEKFYRVQSPTIKRLEGNGIGLYLVDQAVKAHQGHIEVKSEPGHGSTFTVYFPIKSKGVIP
jgi:signal transduction histidine kinase